MKRVILYPGSFDPVQAGHMSIAKLAYKTFAPDEFIFVLQPNMFKPEGMFTIQARNSFLRSAISKHMQSCKVDINLLPTPFFTDYYSNLPTSDSMLGEIHYYVLIGDDCLSNVNKWRDFYKLNEHVTFIIVPRILNWESIEQQIERLELKSSIVVAPPKYVEHKSSTVIRSEVIDLVSSNWENSSQLFLRLGYIINIIKKEVTKCISLIFQLTQ